MHLTAQGVASAFTLRMASSPSPPTIWSDGTSRKNHLFVYPVAVFPGGSHILVGEAQDGKGFVIVFLLLEFFYSAKFIIFYYHITVLSTNDSIMNVLLSV